MWVFPFPVPTNSGLDCKIGPFVVLKCLRGRYTCLLASVRCWPDPASLIPVVLVSCCQGVKRLTCSLYFSAHPEVSRSNGPGKGATATATAMATATAKIKTNPNWQDIRYDPQHHRFARDGNAAVPSSSAGGQNEHSAAGSARPGLWSGAKVQG